MLTEVYVAFRKVKTIPNRSDAASSGRDDDHVFWNARFGARGPWAGWAAGGITGAGMNGTRQRRAVMDQTTLDRADRLTATGIFWLRLAAGVFFLLPGLYKFIQPADFRTMLTTFPDVIQPYLDPLFLVVAILEVLGGIALILGMGTRLAVIPLIAITVVASAFVVRFDTSSDIRVLSLYAHVMGAGLYAALFFLGSGRWALDGNRDLLHWLGQHRRGALSRLARGVVSGWGRNAGVFLLRASIALPFLMVFLLGTGEGTYQMVLPTNPLLHDIAIAVALLGGLSVLTGFAIRRLAWTLVVLTLIHLVFVGVPDAAVSSIGLINILFHALLLAALYALRLIHLGSDLEVDHILNADAQNVVIIGGGFAGTELAQRLEGRLPRTHRVVLISEENYTTFNPLLAEIVGATVLPAHTVASIRRMLGRSRFIMGQVTHVDTDNRRVIYDSEGTTGEIGYDHVVFALGSRANLDLLPGMAAHAFPFKRLGDALALRNRIIEQMERADQTDDAAERQQLGHFIVIGGGFSGIEVAGAIHDFIREAGRHYPRLHDHDLSVSVIHGTDRPLPELPEPLGQFTARSMAARDISVLLNARVEEVFADGVMLKGGQRLHGATVVNTIGTVPNPLLARIGLPTERGRIPVNPDMSVGPVPGAWALGDCALVPNARDGGALSPPTAQFAIRQGHHLADSINRVVRGEPTRPFAYKARGSMASIGHLNGVADLFGIITLTGLPAWMVWRAYYLSLMPTRVRRLQIFFEWTWSMLFSADITALRFTRSQDADRADTDRMPQKAA